MTGSGLGNFGLGNVGIYGQQGWQREAQNERFKNLYAQSLYKMGTAAPQDPMARAKAQYEAAKTMQQQSGGSAIIGGSSPNNIMLGNVQSAMMMRYPQGPAAGEEGAQDWWNKMQTFRFPYS